MLNTKKIIFLVLLLILTIFYFSVPTFASNNSNINSKGTNILFNNNYLGANLILDIKSLEAEDVLLGIGVSKNQYEYSEHYQEKSIEAYLGKRFNKVEPFSHKVTVDLAAGLNNKEGIMLFLNTTFKYSEKFGIGFAINTSSGLLLNLNFNY